MSISSDSTRKAGPFTGTGAIVPLPFSFKVFTTADVLVIRTDLSGVESTLTLSSDYTVTLNSNQDSNPGGVVTPLIAPGVGYLTTLSSQVAAIQSVILTNTGGFFPTVLNDAMDRLTILVQQLKEQMSRAVTTSISSGISPATLASYIVALYGNLANIISVAGNATNINSAVSNAANINAVVANSSNINAVNANAANINAVNTNAANINAVNTNAANINAVAGDLTNINIVAADKANIDIVAADKTNIDSVAGNAANINIVAANNTNVSNVGGSIANVNTVATYLANIITVASNIASVIANALNITSIQNASANATAAASSAAASASSASSSAASAASAAAIVFGSVVTYANNITQSINIPDGYNGIWVDPTTVGPNVTVTGLGNSTLRGI